MANYFFSLPENTLRSLKIHTTLNNIMKIINHNFFVPKAYLYFWLKTTLFAVFMAYQNSHVRRYRGEH